MKIPSNTNTMTTRSEQRLSFDAAADLYDTYRADYPSQLAEDLLTTANVTNGDRILEIGCGTGIATVHFAPYGFSLLALEPGGSMAAIAQQKCTAYPNVEFQQTVFEEWPLEAEAFQLIYAAMSFHWIDPEIAFIKTADALAPGGTLAIIGNHPQRGDSELEQVIQRAYEKVKAVKPPKAHPRAVADNQGGPVERFNNSGRFGTVFSAEYPHSRTYNADEYVQLMMTMSDHRVMPEVEREWLLGEIHSAIERFGGVKKVEYLVKVHFARRL